MKFKLLDEVTLEDNLTYLVMSSLIHNGKEYVYLMQSNRPSNIQFCLCEQEGNDVYLTNIVDKDILTEIVPLFDKKMKEVTGETTE